MNPDLEQLEDELRGLRPEVPDRSLFDRLEAACEGRIDQLDAALKSTESELEKARPAHLPEALAENCEAILTRVSFGACEKVVPFPGAAETRRRRAPSRNGWWAAAAGVALVGGLSALLVGTPDAASGTGGQPVAATNPAPAAEVSKGSMESRSGSFVPSSFGSNVSNASDLGVMWADQGRRPVRVVKVTYEDRATLLNDRGEEVVVKVPRVEYVVVPERID